MQNISFNDGYKTYTINGDENRVIRVNPSDFAIVGRVRMAQEEIEKLKISEPADNDGVIRATETLDAAIRGQIDYIFGDGVSAMVFGSVNCSSLAGGKPVYQNFLEALLPVIEADIEREKKKSDENIRRYTSQVK